MDQAGKFDMDENLVNGPTALDASKVLASVLHRAALPAAVAGKSY